jgi:hypothetical protein
VEDADSVREDAKDTADCCVQVAFIDYPINSVQFNGKSGPFRTAILKQRFAIKKLNSEALVSKRTILTERPPLIGEVSANFCG